MTSSIGRGFAIVAVGFVLMAGFAAVAQTPPSPSSSPPMPVACLDPRPQVCPQIYQPVCALKSGGRTQTYGNGCAACADAEVVAYHPGPCG